MKVLITGGAGFIGSHLSEAFLKQNQSVVAIDDLSTGSIKNVNHLTNNPNFELIEDTVLNENHLKKLIRGVDLVYHLAAVVGVNLVLKDPIGTIKTNVSGTEIILESANIYGKKVIITSSSEIYGRGVNKEFSENDDRIMGPVKNSRWSYACTKAMDEFLAFAYHIKKGLPIVISRLFNTIGSRQSAHYGMVVPNFVQQALKNKDLTVFGDGKQTRCFCNVDDVVNALIILGLSEKANGEVFNIGSSDEISILNLASKIIGITNSKSKIKLVPYTEAYGKGFEDMKRRKPNIDKIKNNFQWEPKISLYESLLQIIEESKNNL